MHEYGLVEALLARVEEIARDRAALSVRVVHVRLGELAGVEPSLLRLSYETFRERTLCAHAPLELEMIPATWQCPRCQRVLERGVVLRCCGVPARLVSGDELVLQRIELELP